MPVWPQAHFMSSLFVSEKLLPAKMEVNCLTGSCTSKFRGWLKADAPLNMFCMFTTLEVSKSTGWLKAVASRNMPYMSVTLDVSKLTGWLKAVAPLNMCSMSVTLEVSQFEMSSLNVVLYWKISRALTRNETSQKAMGPCVAMVDSRDEAYSSSAW